MTPLLLVLLGCAPTEDKRSNDPPAEVAIRLFGEVSNVRTALRPAEDDVFAGVAMGDPVEGLIVVARSAEDANPHEERGNYSGVDVTPAHLDIGSLEVVGSGRPLWLVEDFTTVDHLYFFDGSPDAGGPLVIDGRAEPTVHWYTRLWDDDHTAFDGTELPDPFPIDAFDGAELALDDTTDGSEALIDVTITSFELD